MIPLFLKIFFSGILIIGILISLKKIFSLLIPLLNNKKYLDQLKPFIDNNMYDPQTILQAIHFYIPPKYQELHPYKRPAKGKYRIKRKDLTTAVNKFLNDTVPCRHLILMGNPGMGKTCFALNFYLHNKNRPERTRHTLALIPLRLPNADQLIMSLPDQNNCVLFLDGLDEDIKAFQNPHERVRQIIDQTSRFKRVIITSAVDFIPEISYLPTLKGYKIIEPKNINDSRIYRLKKFYLSPMTSTDIRNNLNSALPFWKGRLRNKIKQLIKENPSLVITPLILNYLGQTITENPNPLSENEIYNTFIQKQIQHELYWEDKPALNLLYRRVATDLFLKWTQSKEDTITTDDLDKKAVEWGISLHDFKNDTRSLLVKNQSGILRFSHRSMMEYLFVQQLVSGDASCYQVSLTSRMKKFFLQILGSNQPLDLKLEFDWLTSFDLKAQGLTRKTPVDNGMKPQILQTILRKNSQYEFLNRINSLFQNPIFYEFGWDPALNENLEQAVFHSKSALMKLDKKKWTVLINPQTIDITKQDQHNAQILINNTDFKEYNSLQNDIPLISLNRELGIHGLRMLNNINQSENIAVLPDLKTYNKFTICFEKSLIQS